MMPAGAWREQRMTASVLASLSSIPILGVLLQGAATGTLIGSAVLVRARRRDLRVEPWAVTASWSLFGALVTSLVLVLAALLR
jgi:hypothetical protein